MDACLEETSNDHEGLFRLRRYLEPFIGGELFNGDVFSTLIDNAEERKRAIDAVELNDEESDFIRRRVEALKSLEKWVSSFGQESCGKVYFLSDNLYSTLDVGDYILFGTKFSDFTIQPYKNDLGEFLQEHAGKFRGFREQLGFVPLTQGVLHHVESNPKSYKQFEGIPHQEFAMQYDMYNLLDLDPIL